MQTFADNIITNLKLCQSLNFKLEYWILSKKIWKINIKDHTWGKIIKK